MAKLTENEHSIWTQPYSTTINKLENYENALKVAREDKANLAKVFAQSEQRNGKQNSNKRSRDSNTEKGEKPKCNTCGKYHHGECRFKKNRSSKPWEKKPRTDFNQMSKQLNYLMKAQAKRTGDDAMSVSDDSDDNVPEWRKGLNENQAMYVAQAYRSDNDLAYDESINHINPDEIKKYKRMYKKAKQSL